MKNQNNAIISHYKVRQAIGFLGIATPILCPVAESIFGNCSPWQIDLSHYYYSHAHIVFVGLLMILSALFFTYRGANSLNNRVANFAGIFAFGVAAFPTDYDGFIKNGNVPFISLHNPIAPFSLIPNHSWVQIVHISSAILLFVCFAIFCLYFFPLDDDNEFASTIEKKKFRNKIYKFCGWMIVVVLIITFVILNIEPKPIFSWLYWCEVLMLIPFGIGWLVKGSVLWNQSKLATLRYFYKCLR